jgi:hypothetical protein
MPTSCAGQAKLARERAERRERALAANAKLKEESEAWARREHDRAVANHKFSKEDLAMLALAKKQQALKIFTPAMFKGFFLNEDALFLKYFGKHCESLWDWVDAKHTAVDELKAWMQTPLPLIEEIAKKKMRKRDKLKDINPFSSKDRGAPHCAAPDGARTRFAPNAHLSHFPLSRSRGEDERDDGGEEEEGG